MDVNQIFKDLGQMIHDQGAVVDSIESSVEHASQNVEAGAQELHQAVNYKVRKRNPDTLYRFFFFAVTGKYTPSRKLVQIVTTTENYTTFFI